MKPKKCRICRDTFTPTRMIQPVCEKFECKVAYANKAAEKSAQNRKAKERREHRAAKERIKKRSEWLAEAQEEFNRFIRMRDADQPCISCGTSNPAIQYAAGHYRTVGANPELRFEELNVHKQCNRRCNRELSGNIINYRPALIKKIGQANLDWLEGHHEPKKYTIDEIKAIKAEYRQKCKELENMRKLAA